MHAGSTGKIIANREVAVAVHQVNLDAGGGSGVQGSDDLLVVGVADIVADPDLEEVAEDVQRLGLSRPPGKEVQKQGSRPG